MPKSHRNKIINQPNFENMNLEHIITIISCPLLHWFSLNYDIKLVKRIEFLKHEIKVYHLKKLSTFRCNSSQLIIHNMKLGKRT